MAKNYDLKKLPWHPQSYSVLPKLTSLQRICLNRIKAMVKSAHRKVSMDMDNLEAEICKLRAYFLELPADIRTSLQAELCMRDDGGIEDTESYPVSLFGLELLFSKGVTMVNIEVPIYYQQRHRDRLLKLLSNEGNSLRSLSFYEWFVHNPGDNHQLTNILVIAENLVALSLRSTCDNTILKTIGLRCTRLKFLDVSYFLWVKQGLNFLIQSMIRVEPGSKSEDAVCQSSMWKYRNIVLPLENLVPAGHTSEGYQWKRSPLCDTLKILVIRNSTTTVRVPIEFIMMILELIPGLETFGKWDMQEFFEAIHSDLVRFGRHIEELPQLSLTSITMSSMSKETHALINWMCPQLQSLEYGNLSKVHRNSFNDLQSLIVEGENEVHRICDLSPQLKESMTYLKITVFQGHVPFNLHHLMSEYPSLRAFHLSLGDTIWPKELELHDMKGCWKHENLESIYLDVVSFETLVRILECTPNTEKVKVHKILQKPKDFVQRFCEEVKLPNLKLLIDNSGLVNTKEELTYLVSHFPSINVVGKLMFL